MDSYIELELVLLYHESEPIKYLYYELNKTFTQDWHLTLDQIRTLALWLMELNPNPEVESYLEADSRQLILF